MKKKCQKCLTNTHMWTDRMHIVRESLENGQVNKEIDIDCRLYDKHKPVPPHYPFKKCQSLIDYVENGCVKVQSEIDIKSNKKPKSVNNNKSIEQSTALDKLLKSKWSCNE